MTILYKSATYFRLAALIEWVHSVVADLVIAATVSICCPVELIVRLEDQKWMQFQ